MNYYKYFFIILLIFLNTSSCKKDFLNIQDNSAALRQVYINDLKTTGDFLNGIYIMLSSDFYSSNSCNNQIYPDMVADNIKPTGSTLAEQYYWSQISTSTTSSSNMNSVWETGYKIIRACSFVIEKSEQYRNQDIGKSDNMKAQAYALRAFVHFVLVNIFAQSYNFTVDASHPGIPYVTTSDWTVPVTRNTVAEVYTNIVSDLNIALPLFGSEAINVLLMNRNAAKALLARICLFKKDYTAAKNLAREVLTAVPIMTSNYPEKLFTPQETETLFQLLSSSSYVGDTYDTFFSGVYFSSAFGLPFVATNDIADILTENTNDQRRGWVTQTSGVWRITKFPVGVVAGYPYPEASYYQTLIRSSEMSLTAAESYAKLNNEDSARFYLDAIRTRANPSASPSVATGEALLDSIYKERRKELAFEGFRMFDLLRWKKGVDRIDAIDPAAKNLPYPSNKAISPIPGLDVSVAGLPQNTGY